ncbi:hypothetical protein FRC16_010923 [Serendipita sp. 398]|nr:hypothetical protein FRC16_010923 [Serendipita sp. 398]
MFAISTFGMAFVVTFAVTERMLGITPDQLLIGALAAGAPIMVGEAITHAGVIGNYVPIVVGFDALAGYTFARVAHTHGLDVCSFCVAFAPGASFGVLLSALKAPVIVRLDAHE